MDFLAIRQSIPRMFTSLKLEADTLAMTSKPLIVTFIASIDCFWVPARAFKAQLVRQVPTDAVSTRQWTQRGKLFANRVGMVMSPRRDTPYIMPVLFYQTYFSSSLTRGARYFLPSLFDIQPFRSNYFISLRRASNGKMICELDMKTTEKAKWVDRALLIVLDVVVKRSIRAPINIIQPFMPQPTSTLQSKHSLALLNFPFFIGAKLDMIGRMYKIMDCNQGWFLREARMSLILPYSTYFISHKWLMVVFIDLDCFKALLSSTISDYILPQVPACPISLSFADVMAANLSLSTFISWLCFNYTALIFYEQNCFCLFRSSCDISFKDSMEDFRSPIQRSFAFILAYHYD